MTFFTRLEDRVKQIDSLLCIGLDPHWEELASPTPRGVFEYCKSLIEETCSVAAAFKPNSAFFEMYGAEGIRVLSEVIQLVPEEIPVILDAKRGDIASTAQAYARAVFEELRADAVTLSPYLGYDSLEPFLIDPERGVFLLCKTSNPGASDFQELGLATLPGSHLVGQPAKLYELVAVRAAAWNSRGNLGLVVGATQPEALRRVRELAPDLWILAPGVGAQGGDLRIALQAGLRLDGLGMLVPVSRGISRAKDPRKAAENYKQQINREKSHSREMFTDGKASTLDRTERRNSLAIRLLESGCVQFGRFTLKSGLESPIYVDLRRLASYPDLLSSAAEGYADVLSPLSFDRLAAIPYAALPIATAISLQTGKPLVYPRKEVKDYGTQAAVEGENLPGEKVVVIDDLATTGGSKFEAIEKLTAVGLLVSDVVVLIDRQSGAREALAKAGYSLHSVFTLMELVEFWSKLRLISTAQKKEVLDFIGNSLR